MRTNRRRRPPSLFFGGPSREGPRDEGRREEDPAVGLAVEAEAGAQRAAVVWSPAGGLRRVLADSVDAAHLTPLVAPTFRHVASSVSAGARPLAEVVVLDFDAVTATDLSELASIRWAGFAGPIIAITESGELDPITRERYQVEAVLRRRRVSTTLTELLNKLSQAQ